MSSVGPVAGRKRGIGLHPPCPKLSFFSAGVYIVFPSPGPSDAGVKSGVHQHMQAQASANGAELAPGRAGMQAGGCEAAVEAAPG